MNETKKSQHTPGPWSMDDPAENCPQHGKGGEQVFKVVAERFGGGLVADVSCWWYDRETARANARLMAAAPEMLEALEGILNNLWKDRKRDVKRDYSLMVYEAQAKTAISKARGE
jgi:hypothetical protein